MTGLAVGVPAPALRPWVDRYLGYRQHSAAPLVRREVAGAFVVLILGWGDPLDVIEPRQADRGAYGVDSFVAGIFDSYCLTRTVGTGSGIELLLTPLAARRILGLPLGELTNRAVGVTDLPGGWLRRLRVQLAEATGWPQRFALLDTAIAARLAATEDPDPRLAFAWRQLGTSAGRVPIGALADEVGWSRRHLAAMFRREMGPTPKVVARLLRFQRAYAVVQPPAGSPPVVVSPDDDCWAEVATRCGYFDQAHLIRDFREFTGVTPTALIGERAAAS